MTHISDCKVIPLPREEDPRGNLTYIYENAHVPFPIRRVFYIYDVPEGLDRGTHAHKECQQFIIAVSGSLDVYLDDGENSRTIHLSRPDEGLYVPAGIWAHEINFSKGCVCLVLASHPYSEEDYIRQYDAYKAYLDEQKKA